MTTTETIDYKQLYEQAQFKIASLNHELANLKKLLFGSKQERFIPEPVKGSMVQGTLDLHLGCYCGLRDYHYHYSIPSTNPYRSNHSKKRASRTYEVT